MPALVWRGLTASFESSTIFVGGGAVLVLALAVWLYTRRDDARASAAPAFTTAGPHFNPAGRKHGLDGADGPHAGDLPNLEADKDGKAHYDVTTDRVTLGPGPASLFNADGTAVVIHAREDDQKTDPAGNSGDRLACGVVRKT